MTKSRQRRTAIASRRGWSGPAASLLPVSSKARTRSHQAYDNTFGTVLPVPYLSKTVAAQGALLENYYGTSHFSEGNYLSLVSGQAVTLDNQDDCTNYGGGLGSNRIDINVAGLMAYDQVKGVGCIYPPATLTIADQLTAKGLTWKGYMEDMGNDPTREQATCGQPSAGIGAPDNTTSAQVPPKYNSGGTRLVVDQYAARHNPFTYFHSLLDSGECAKHVVPLGDGTLTTDLAAGCGGHDAELCIHHAEPMQRRSRCTVQNGGQPFDVCE